MDLPLDDDPAPMEDPFAPTDEDYLAMDASDPPAPLYGDLSIPIITVNGGDMYTDDLEVGSTATERHEQDLTPSDGLLPISPASAVSDSAQARSGDKGKQREGFELMRACQWRGLLRL